MMYPVEEIPRTGYNGRSLAAHTTRFRVFDTGDMSYEGVVPTRLGYLSMSQEPKPTQGGLSHSTDTRCQPDYLV